MDITNYCDVETCIALAELGYNNSCEYTWVHNCRVSDEILAKHPGLSDSGYMDLIDEYGGPYKREEVYHTYIEPIKRFSRNSLIDTGLGEICSCIHLYDAQKWLRTVKKLHITIFSSSQESWMYRITKQHQKLEDGFYEEDLPTYEDVLLQAIRKCIKICEENVD